MIRGVSERSTRGAQNVEIRELSDRARKIRAKSHRIRIVKKAVLWSRGAFNLLCSAVKQNNILTRNTSKSKEDPFGRFTFKCCSRIFDAQCCSELKTEINFKHLPQL